MVTAPQPAPVAKSPVEKKVTWSTVGAYIASLVMLAILNAVGNDNGLISGLPDWLEDILLPLIPAAISFLSGWSAKHTPRPDLPASGASASNLRAP